MNIEIEIEKVENGYIIVLPKNEFNEVIYEKKLLYKKKILRARKNLLLSFKLLVH